MPVFSRLRLPPPPRRRRLQALLAAAAGAAALAACGGGGALDNAPNVANPAGTATGQSLSFAYFQRCVQPVLSRDLTVRLGNATTLASCAASGCHDNTNGTGGALRLNKNAPAVDLANTLLTPEQIRATEMYRNFYSSQGESIIGNPLSSRMLTKPLVRNVLHGGGLIFDNPDTPEARILRYWISRPMPSGQDEFSSAAAAMFTPADIVNGQCNVD
jgi:hypothetical protein